jgi:hypothetical protein
MESSEAAGALAALSQETRLDLMRLLIAQGATGLPAGDLGPRPCRSIWQHWNVPA